MDTIAMENALKALKSSGFALLMILLAVTTIYGQRTQLEYAPAPVANPLKGLVPYAGVGDDVFPHSMEFSYFRLSDLMTGYDSYNWQPLEELLDAVSGRGRQAIFRIYLEWPNRTDLIPGFLLDDGLKVFKYLNTNTQPHPPSDVETPDYEDVNLRRALTNLIAALGRRYDGDPRIGFITAGLLGTWGEWHTYPRDDLFASKTVQAEIMDAYEAAFKITPVLLRYPAGDDDPVYVSNADRPFGYHDDSFGWATIPTSNQGQEWYYMNVLAEAGPAALDKWKKQPIGGEVRPEAWGKIFDPDPQDSNIQDFGESVDQTHVTWLMDSGMFREIPGEERMKRALAEVRRMGYEFHIPAVTTGDAANTVLPVQIELENHGVAPFYYDWKGEYGLIADDRVIKTFPAAGTLTGLLPGDSPRIWADELDVSDVPSGDYILAVRIPNPLPAGMPVRFANAEQDRNVPGWLSLTRVTIRN
jgi:hypothetical protein